MVVVALVAMLAILVSGAAPALGSPYFFGQAPPAPTGSLVYRDQQNGPVVLSNHGGSWSSVGISAELYRYDRDVYGDGSYDRYTLRVLGEANSRVSHKPRLVQYGNFFDPCGGGYCEGSGITAGDQGKWIWLGFKFYFYGHAFEYIFVCANGWAAFVYEGSENSCPSRPQPLPTPDYKDGSGNIINTPDAIIAPLWKPLDPTVMGGILIYRSGTPPGPALFGVYWNNIVTSGTATSCLGGWCQNYFSFSINNVGEIRFGYDYVDSRDPWNGLTMIGVEDSAGAFGQSFAWSTVVNNKGALLKDDNYNLAMLHRAQLVVDKLTSDTSFVQYSSVEIAGYNIRTTNPPAPHESWLDVAGAVAEEAGIVVLCAIVPGGQSILGCIAIGTAVREGIALLGNYLAGMKKPLDLAQFSMPGVTKPAMQSGDSSAYLETPVQDQKLICGEGVRISDGQPFHDCDVDTALFDTLEWYVPVNTNPHTLRVTFRVNYGATQDGTSALWDSTNIELTVAGRGVALFSDNFQNTAFSNTYWGISGPWSFTGGVARYGPYNTGSRSTGTLTSTVFKVHWLGCSVKFRSWFDTRLGTAVDLKYLQVSTNRGSSWTNALQISDSIDPIQVWTSHAVSLDPFLGPDPSYGVDVMVRFSFDSVTGTATNYGGWSIDDFKICESSSRTVTLRPDGNGAVIEWKMSGRNGANWDRVDEATSDGDTTYVYASRAGNQDRYAMSSMGSLSPGETIAGVTVHAMARLTRSDAAGSLRLSINGYLGTLTSCSLTTVYADCSYVFGTNPATGRAWTASDVEALQAGIYVLSLSRGYIRVTQVWAAVQVVG